MARCFDGSGGRVCDSGGGGGGGRRGEEIFLKVLNMFFPIFLFSIFQVLLEKENWKMENCFLNRT